MSRRSRTHNGFDADQATDTLLMARPLQVGRATRDIAEVRKRIAKATLDCDTWRAAGFSEKYLESYSLMEALEVEMKALEGAQLSARTREVLPISDGPAVSPPVTSGTGDREQLMTGLSIAYDGLRYHYDGYRYDRLDDAVSYAKLQRSRATDQARVPMPAPAMVEGPRESDRRTMASFSITYEAGTYRLGEYRYDRLSDASAYARLRQTLPGTVGTL